MIFDFRSVLRIRLADRIDDLVGALADRNIDARVLDGAFSLELKRQVRLISLSTNQMPVWLLDDLRHLLSGCEAILPKTKNQLIKFFRQQKKMVYDRFN